MDKQTERMWEAEFRKQYPKPENAVWRPLEAGIEFHEANNAAIRAKVHAMHVEYGITRHVTDGDVHAYKRYYLKERPSQDSPWVKWKKECYERFNTIFSASPVYALEELRKGNLLVEGNI